MKFLALPEITETPSRPSLRNFILFFAICATVSSAPAALVEWGTTLNTGLISSSGTATYTNVNGQGYDLVLITQNLTGEGSGNFGIVGNAQSSWWFEGQKGSLTSSASFRFYSTGTTTPIALTGVHFRFEDAEVGEQFVDLGYWDMLGIWQPLSSTSSVFAGTTPGLTTGLPPNYLQNNSVYESRSQTGKAIDVDLSSLPISGFRFTPHRSTSTAGSVEMTGLGDLQVFVSPIPEPNTALFGLAITGILTVVRRRAS